MSSADVGENVMKSGNHYSFLFYAHKVWDSNPEIAYCEYLLWYKYVFMYLFSKIYYFS